MKGLISFQIFGLSLFLSLEFIHQHENTSISTSPMLYKKYLIFMLLFLLMLIASVKGWYIKWKSINLQNPFLFKVPVYSFSFFQSCTQLFCKSCIIFRLVLKYFQHRDFIFLANKIGIKYRILYLFILSKYPRGRKPVVLS